MAAPGRLLGSPPFPTTPCTPGLPPPGVLGLRAQQDPVPRGLEPGSWLCHQTKQPLGPPAGRLWAGTCSAPHQPLDRVSGGCWCECATRLSGLVLPWETRSFSPLPPHTPIPRADAVASGKCGRGRQSGHSLCSQWTPVLPGGQVQLPVTGSQAAPCPHLHTWAQPGPKRPCGQAAGRKQDGGHPCRLPFSLPCQPADRVGCGDLPCPCPPWHLPSTRSSAGGQASSAGTGTPCYPHPTAPS